VIVYRPVRAATGPAVPSPPEHPSERPGGGRDWRLLTTARNQIVGHMVQGVLNAQGIECLMEGFNGSPGAWLKPFGDPLAPVRLYVRRYDLESASLILHEVDHQPAEPDGPVGRRIRAMWLGSMLTIFAATALLLLELVGRPVCLLGIYCLP
jgi:hypothetical protein